MSVALNILHSGETVGSYEIPVNVDVSFGDQIESRYPDITIEAILMNVASDTEPFSPFARAIYDAVKSISDYTLTLTAGSVVAYTSRPIKKAQYRVAKANGQSFIREEVVFLAE